MTDHDEVLELANLPYPEARAALAPIVHERLSKHEDFVLFRTADVAEMLVPRTVQLERKKDMMRLFYILTLLAKHELRSCVSEKADENSKGEPVMRKLWRNGPLKEPIKPTQKPIAPPLDTATLRETWPKLDETLAALRPDLNYAVGCGLIANLLHPILLTIPREKPIETMAVAVRMLPSTCKVSHPAEYNRLFRILKDLGKGQLKDCTSPGTPRKYMGRVAHPKLWHTGPLHSYDALATVKPAKNPAATSTDHTICQHCGSILPKV